MTQAPGPSRPFQVIAPCFCEPVYQLSSSPAVRPLPLGFPWKTFHTPHLVPKPVLLLFPFAFLCIKRASLQGPGAIPPPWILPSSPSSLDTALRTQPSTSIDIATLQESACFVPKCCLLVCIECVIR